MRVLRRCLAMIRRLQRGPARWSDLVEAVRWADEVEDPYGGATGKALRKRVENDLHRIRGHLGVEVRYSRRSGGRIIRDLRVPPLDWMGLGCSAEAPAFAEGLRGILPFWRAHPRAFAELAETLRELYLDACRAAGIEPEEELIGKWEESGEPRDPEANEESR